MIVRFFSRARELAGCECCEIPLEAPIDADELWKRLEEQFPLIAELRGATRLARNHEYLSGDAMFNDKDEAALIPPVSGG